MRPFLFGTDSTQELRIACERLARGFRATRGERARLCCPGICTSPAPQKTEIPPISIQKPHAKFIEPLGALTVIASVALGTVVLLGSGNLLADNLIKGLRDAEQRRIDEGNHFFKPGHRYNLILPDGRPMHMLFKGTVPTRKDLPKVDNQIGDLWAIGDEWNTWVWAVPTGGSVATWIDP